MDIWRRPAARRSPGNHFSIEKSRLEFPAQSTGTVHGQNGFRVGKWPAIARGPRQPISAPGGTFETFWDVRSVVANRRKADVVRSAQFGRVDPTWKSALVQQWSNVL